MTIVHIGTFYTLNIYKKINNPSTHYGNSDLIYRLKICFKSFGAKNVLQKFFFL